MHHCQEYSVHHTSRQVTSVCPTFCDANLDHLVQVVFARCPHYKGTVFPFVINRESVGRCLWLFTTSCSPAHLHPMIASIADSCLGQLLLWCLLNGDFLTLSFLKHVFVGIPLQRGACPQPLIYYQFMNSFKFFILMLKLSYIWPKAASFS